MEANSLAFDELAPFTQLQFEIPELELPEIPIEHVVEKNRFRRFIGHVGALRAEARADYNESEQKAAFIGRTALAATTQLAERAQFSGLVIPAVTLDVLSQTGSPVVAGIVAGSIAYAWNNIVGESLTEGLSKVPKAVSKYKEHYTRSTEVVFDTLPRDHTHETLPGEHKSKAKRIGQTILYHTLNGVASTLRGVSSYVATTTVKGDRAKSEIKKFYRTAALDGAIAVAIFAGVATGALTNIAASNPELASKIEYYGGNKIALFALLAVFAAGEFVMNRRRKAKMNIS